MVFAERVERLAAHETVIGVVGYRLGTHPLEHLVEGFGGGALEPCVLLACGTHSVDNLVAVAESVDEPVDRVHIVLQVGVHGYHDVALCLFETTEQCRRLPVVAAELNAPYLVRSLCLQLLDYLPGTVGTSVVNENHFV